MDYEQKILYFIPIIQIWPAIELFFLKGTNGENKYGPDPLGGIENESTDNKDIDENTNIEEIATEKQNENKIEPNGSVENDELKNKLDKIKELLDEDLISQEEYEQKKQEITELYKT